LTGHTGSVTAVSTAVAPDGTLLVVTGSQDRTAVVWDAVTGARLHTLTGHRNWIQAVETTATPDGIPVAITTSQDSSAVVWDLRSGKEMHHCALQYSGGPVVATRTGFLVAYWREVASFVWS
ncbi:hypothetical protein ACFV6F_08240, partial [Kitasatospora phosalacinea]